MNDHAQSQTGEKKTRLKSVTRDSRIRLLQDCKTSDSIPQLCYPLTPYLLTNCESQYSFILLDVIHLYLTTIIIFLDLIFHVSIHVNDESMDQSSFISKKGHV